MCPSSVALLFFFFKLERLSTVTMRVCRSQKERLVRKQNKAVKKQNQAIPKNLSLGNYNCFIKSA